MTSMRLFRLLLVLLLCTTAATLADTQTCELNQDGTCVEQEDSKNASNDDNDTACKDTNPQCAFWASKDECEANPAYMYRNCPKACGVCNSGRSIDSLIQETLRTKNKDAEYDIKETPFGVKQEVMPGPDAQKTQEIVTKTERYYHEVVATDPAYDKVRKECKNRHPQCAFWAAMGECEANPNYMVLQCAPSCQTCDKIDFEARCPFDKDAPSIFGPGDVDAMFKRITTDEFYQQYEPEIHSKPPEGPWVVTLENFTTEQECTRLIALGADKGYERSKDVGAKKFDGTYDGYENKGRTSTNAWCTDQCYNDTLTKSVLAKIENVTGIPEANSEYLQLLRYDVSQFYHTHNDYIPHQVKREEGVRVLTVFLYLNDVEEGGGTNFPKLDITVSPKRGRAVIWPSVLNANPHAKDGRTDHQALPVEKGIKYGANAWLHQRGFKAPYERGCV